MKWHSETTLQAMTTHEIEEASGEDEEFVELRACIANGNWVEDKHKQYVAVSSELHYELSYRVVTLAH